jgi:hypothetical protein
MIHSGPGVGWADYRPTPAFRDDAGREYVRLWKQQEAFGIKAPRGLDIEHWWFETPTHEVGMGPVDSPWGTDPGPGGPTWSVAITDHSDFGREIMYRDGKLVTGQGPRGGYDSVRIYGPNGFTGRLVENTPIGKSLGRWGVPWDSGTCQAFVIRELSKAGAVGIPEPLWSSPANGMYLDLLFGGDTYTVYGP